MEFKGILNRITNHNGIVITDSNGNYTFDKLFDRISQDVKYLESNLETNDIVILYSDYNFYSICLFLSLTQFNVTICPVVRTTETELEQKIKVAKATIIIELNLEGEKSIRRINSNPLPIENPELLLFSSGTSGVPKAMVHQINNLTESITDPKRQRRLKFLIFLMFDHIGGINTLFNCLVNGSTIIIPEDKSPSKILHLIDREQVNVLPVTPTFLNLMLLNGNIEDFNLSSLKLITYGTEKMSQGLLNLLHSKLPNVKLLQTFGTSETGILKTISKASNSLFFKIIDKDK